MFGLDARITLVVIASLSIITSAVMMSTVKSTVAAQYLNDIKNVALAYQTFKADTGYDVDNYKSDGTSQYYKIYQLIKLSANHNKPYTLKYKGPYLDYARGINYSMIINPTEKYSVMLASRSFKNNWSSFTEKCNATDCFVWVQARSIEEDIANKIDELVDGEISPTTGLVRTENAGTNTLNLFYAIERE
jgi:hypothetical protein